MPAPASTIYRNGHRHPSPACTSPRTSPFGHEASSARCNRPPSRACCHATRRSASMPVSLYSSPDASWSDGRCGWRYDHRWADVQHPSHLPSLPCSRTVVQLAQPAVPLCPSIASPLSPLTMPCTSPIAIRTNTLFSQPHPTPSMPTPDPTPDPQHRPSQPSPLTP